MTEITQEQFKAYVDVQESGVTNMFDVKTVGELSGLSKEEIMSIMKSYGELKDIDKPELSPSQLDDIYEAVESGVGEFDFSDTDNFDKEFNIDYDNRIQLENFDFTNSTDLVEMIVEKVSKLFVETIDDEEGNKGPGNE